MNPEPLPNVAYLVKKVVQVPGGSPGYAVCLRVVSDAGVHEFQHTGLHASREDAEAFMNDIHKIISKVHT